MQQILKIDPDRQRIYATAFVADTIDAHNHTITNDELEEAACRAGRMGDRIECRIDHEAKCVGRLCASFPMTPEIANALGFSLPSGNGLWIVGLQIDDADTWAAVKAGSIGWAVSIAGNAIFEEEDA